MGEIRVSGKLFSELSGRPGKVSTHFTIKPNWKQQLFNLNLQHNQPSGYLIIIKLDWQCISYMLIKSTKRKSCIWKLQYLLTPYESQGWQRASWAVIWRPGSSPASALTGGCVTLGKPLSPSEPYGSNTRCHHGFVLPVFDHQITKIIYKVLCLVSHKMPTTIFMCFIAKEMTNPN